MNRGLSNREDMYCLYLIEAWLASNGWHFDSRSSTKMCTRTLYNIQTNFLQY